ncbi:putative branched-chain alpha-keto acid dehydrogenase, dihydrolipoamide acyltransferase (E2) component [Nitrospira japonica]|uniref:Dihydrolipoamide acetyltransferase component of pyruvate dehydrogenase complex n=1 Tax=Nitrospira japonica TaxID=1325564 RepID=A0A1W1I146_9BACT|nr:dihydrolipoamide acetyltransferase family protein [Nitrospira japonica]SLM46717.1 putative branched-chain alpha-keto acid dehydrogenase, dihydrolipoamide acyltransferase (E2) component [Nitrospira japonica]
MATDIIMPQLGESVAEGTVVKWFIRPGGMIQKDQALVEVETEKVDLDIPSPVTGVLSEIIIPEGGTVPVGTLLARIESTPPSDVINRVGGVIVRPSQPVSDGDGRYSPAVRQLATAHGLDLSHVKGTGTGGRVTKKDVQEFIAETGGLAASPPAGTELSMGEEVRPLTQMRRTIAERMVSSRRTSAHVTTFFEADFSGVAKFRDTLRQSSGQSVTYLPFVIRAVTRAIRDLPVLNSSWREDGIVIKKDIHLGIATALDEGLLVPVVRHADRKGLTLLAKEVADLAERARTKKLNPEEVQGGTFTITNHGGFGSLFSTPIIHQPQTAILGVGAIQKRPMVIDDAIAIRTMGYLSLSFDHRVIDGATADQFMAKVRDYLEQSQWEPIL